MTRILTSGQRALLDNLLKAGTAEESLFSPEDYLPLIDWHYVRMLPPNKIGITTLGTEAMLSPETVAATRSADKRAGTREKTKFEPMTTGMRELLLRIHAAGGTLKSADYDGRVAFHLVKRGLILKDESGTLTLTPAGEKRIPPRPLEPTRPPMSETPSVAAPTARLDIPSPRVESPAAVSVQPPPEPRREISVTVTVDGMDEAHFKARVLDMLMATSPSVQEFYEAVHAAELAAGRLKGI